MRIMLLGHAGVGMAELPGDDTHWNATCESVDLLKAAAALSRPSNCTLVKTGPVGAGAGAATVDWLFREYKQTNAYLETVSSRSRRDYERTITLGSQEPHVRRPC
jgi:hypothetical protein